MRRKERSIADRQEIDAILHSAPVLYLSMIDSGKPYVVPMNFGYDGSALYLHSALEGRKIHILQRNPRVCFAVATDFEVIPGEEACLFSARFRSVIGEGIVTFLNTPDEKIHGLDILMAKFASGPFQYRPEALEHVTIIKVAISDLSGKQAGSR